MDESTPHLHLAYIPVATGYDIDGYVRDLGVWIGNYNKKYGVKLRYVLIPEQHKDVIMLRYLTCYPRAEARIKPPLCCEPVSSTEGLYSFIPLHICNMLLP